MKRRFCSQYLYAPPEGLLRHWVVEHDSDSGRITDLFPLGNGCAESARTLFVDGVISAAVCSPRQRLSSEQLNSLHRKYSYIDLSAGICPECPSADTHKPWLFDFGTDEPAVLNDLLAVSAPFLSRFPLLTVLAGSVYYPALECTRSGTLAVGASVALMCWSGVDLLQKRVTARTRMKVL